MVRWHLKASVIFEVFHLYIKTFLLTTLSFQVFFNLVLGMLEILVPMYPPDVSWILLFLVWRSCWWSSSLVKTQLLWDILPSKNASRRTNRRIGASRIRSLNKNGQRKAHSHAQKNTHIIHHINHINIKVITLLSYHCCWSATSHGQSVHQLCLGTWGSTHSFSLKGISTT